MVHAFDLSTLETEVGGSLSVLGHPGLYSELENSKGYKERPQFKKKLKVIIFSLQIDKI